MSDLGGISSYLFFLLRFTSYFIFREKDSIDLEHLGMFSSLLGQLPNGPFNCEYNLSGIPVS